ncbi:hypothetical protein ACFLTZ_03295 [Chloroflexota bacterium]
MLKNTEGSISSDHRAGIFYYQTYATATCASIVLIFLVSVMNRTAFITLYTAQTNSLTVFQHFNPDTSKWAKLVGCEAVFVDSLGGIKQPVLRCWRIHLITRHSVCHVL